MPRRRSIGDRVGMEVESSKKDCSTGQIWLVQIQPWLSRLPHASRSIDLVQLCHEGEAKFAGREGRQKPI